MQYERNVGCSVAQVSGQDVYEICLLRATLEILAARLLQKGKSVQQALQQMQDCVGQMEQEDCDFYQLAQQDNRFHAAVIEQAGLKKLAELWKSTNIHNLAIFYAGRNNGSFDRQEYCQSHQRLLECYHTGDICQISKEIVQHYSLKASRRLKMYLLFLKKQACLFCFGFPETNLPNGNFIWLMHAKACKDKKQKESLLSPKGETIMKIKRILAVMLAGAMMLSMAACGGESKEESNAQTSAEQKTIDGNVLDAEQYFNGYLSADPTTLDGVIGNDSIGGGVLNNVMEPLTRLAEKDGKNIREGAGAESWESNEDGTVWTFHLRENTWSDGQPVKAQDYVYSIVRTLTPETGSPNSYLLTCVKNANAVLAGEMDPSELGCKSNRRQDC